MKTSRRTRKVLVTAAAAAVIIGAASGSFALLDSEPGESQRNAPASYTGDWKDLVSELDSPVTDAGANPWAANDPAVILRALKEQCPGGPQLTPEMVDDTLNALGACRAQRQ